LQTHLPGALVAAQNYRAVWVLNVFQSLRTHAEQKNAANDTAARKVDLTAKV
jgi:hypothetical protein